MIRVLVSGGGKMLPDRGWTVSESDLEVAA
jgi:hypothetical protein